MTIEQFYYDLIRPRPIHERFRFAKIILNDIAAEPQIDDNDDWSEENLR